MSSSTTLCAVAVAAGMIASAAVLPTALPSRAASDPPDAGIVTDVSTTEGAQIEAASQRDEHNAAEPLIRARLTLDPDKKAQRRQLTDMVGDRTPPRDSESYRATRALLPARFIEHETRRFLVLSDADANWTRLQAERLERAHHQFMRFARKIDLDPLPLRHKLVCVLFQQQEDYLEFAAAHDHLNARWMAGYYSPRHDRIVFYNVETGANVHEARRQLAEMNEEVDAYRRKAAEARRAGERDSAARIDQSVRRYERHLAQQQQQLNAFAADTLIATTIHEATHQLAFHTRIQHPHVHYPHWISEGLATVFETNTPNQAFGPAHEHDERRAAFASLLREDRLMPLRQLVTCADREALSPNEAAALYHQSYALVMWMYRFRDDELRDYLRLMRNAPQRPLSQQHHLELFESAFGRINDLERAWLRHEHATDH